MATPTTSPAETAPDFATLLERARGLRELIEHHAEEQEQQGELSDQVVQALRDAGVFGMAVPAVLGGSELRPLEVLEVLESIAYADASTGWVSMTASSGCAVAGAYLGEEAVAQIFGGPQPPIVAGQGTRPGKAVAGDGGFQLSGAWSFGSGLKHADWVHSGALVQESGEVRIMVTPKAVAELDDNWDVMGLRATGSIDYTIDDAWVPDAFSHLAATTTPLRGGRVYELGVLGLICLGHSSWALGVGRRMLDEVLDLVASKAGRPGSLGDSEGFQLALAKAEGDYRAARALVVETWRDTEAAIERGETLTTRHHSLLRLALVHATWTVAEISQFAYGWAGTVALRRGVLQRCFRDVHGGTQHITSSPMVQSGVGRELCGRAENHEWRFLALVPR